MRVQRRSLLPKIARWIIALALLPVCWGATAATARVVRASGDAVPFWLLGGAGAICWLIVFSSLPRPMWLYVVGHELTHALWTWLFGGRVRTFRATARGGHVSITKVNFLIVLAPYFFPLYALLWAAVCLLTRAFTHWPWLDTLFHFGLGITYAFHVTLTLHILRTRQPDLELEGWFFSGVIIWLGNVFVALLALPLLTQSVGLLTALKWVGEGVGEFFGAWRAIR